MNVNTYSNTCGAVLLDSTWLVPMASSGGDTTCDNISYWEWVSEGNAAVSGAPVASPAVAGSYQNTSKTWKWPFPCPGCALLRKSPACTVTIPLSKSNKYIQMYTELPTSRYFSRTVWEKKRASSGLLLRHWKFHSWRLKDYEKYIYFCMLFLHDIIPRKPVPKRQRIW